MGIIDVFVINNQLRNLGFGFLSWHVYNIELIPFHVEGGKGVMRDAW